MKFTAGFYK